MHTSAPSATSRISHARVPPGRVAGGIRSLGGDGDGMGFVRRLGHADHGGGAACRRAGGASYLQAPDVGVADEPIGVSRCGVGCGSACRPSGPPRRPFGRSSSGPSPGVERGRPAGRRLPAPTGRRWCGVSRCRRPGRPAAGHSAVPPARCPRSSPRAGPATWSRSSSDGRGSGRRANSGWRSTAAGGQCRQVRQGLRRCCWLSSHQTQLPPGTRQLRPAPRDHNRAVNRPSPRLCSQPRSASLVIFARSGSSLPRAKVSKPSRSPTALTCTGPSASRTIARIVR